MLVVDTDCPLRRGADKSSGDKPVPTHRVHAVRAVSECGTDPAVPPLVLLHGYSWGVGVYYATLPQLAQRWRGEVFAVDMPGCGLSSR